MKSTSSKIKDLKYEELRTQQYLTCPKFNNSERNLLYALRSRMYPAKNNFKKMNSSIFRLQAGSMPNIYLDFIKRPQVITNRYPGDQDWIYANLKNTSNFEYWPDEWIRSYK